MKIPRPRFMATLAADTVNEKNRTVDVTFYTGAAVPRFSWSKGEYMLAFDMTPAAVRMGALNGGTAPVLNSHNSYSLDAVIGVVERAELKEDNGVATIRFAADDEAAEGVWNKVKQGVIRNVSMGSYIHKMKDVTKDAEAKVREFLAIDWEPVEISLVAIGADPGAHVNMGDERTSIEVEVLGKQVLPVEPGDHGSIYRLAIEEARLRLF